MFLQDRPYRLLLPLLFLILTCSFASAGTVGKISGVVTSQESGDPLGQANVAIVGTTMGAVADQDGKFFILNIPAGTYQLQATVVGYKPKLISDIRVVPDFTTEVLFDLEQTVLGVVETVEITAEKPLIQKDLTGSTRFLAREEIENMPTRGYQEAASLQAGIVSQSINQDVSTADIESSNAPRLHVRGGRAEEVAYFVDGFSQQDPLTGLSTTSINQNAIEQIVVLTGGFNAEYGKVMSGAVNVITREGTSDYFGSLELITDNLGGDWVGSKVYDYNTYDISLGGPVIPGNQDISFFVSGERRWQRDRNPKPIEGIGLSAEQEAMYADGQLPNNDLSGFTYQGRLTWDVTPSMKLRGGTLGSNDDWQEYRHQYLFNQPHMPRYEDKNQSVFGTFTHSLNPKTFYSVGVNWFYTERYRGDGVFMKDLMAYSTGREDGNPRFDSSNPVFWFGPTVTDTSYADTTAHVWDDYLHRESSYLGFKSDVSFQWSPENQAKVGAEYRYHTLRRYRHLFPTRAWEGIDAGGFQDVDRYGYALDNPESEIDSGLDGPKHPKDASFFIQNKYEKEEFVLNAGLRYDYLDVDTEVLVDENLPLGEDRTNLDEDEDLKAGDAEHKVSPRLGVGFPIGERTQFHANYGIFFQQPNLQDLYVSYAFLEHKTKTGGYYYPFGNPNLEPETTTAYEIGFTQQVSDRSKFDMTAFYKNVQDLVQVQSIASAPNSYSSFRNTDYGTVKGLDMSFELRRTSNISATLNYTYSFANGTGSVANTQRNIAWQAGPTVRPPKQTAPLDFDQRHKLAVNIDWRLGEKMGPMLGDTYILQNMGVNVLANLGSGNPFTPTKAYDEITLAAVSPEPSGPINSQYGPWRYRIDMKVDRAFHVSGLKLSAYVWVLNLFDRRNSATVYTSTGDSETTGWLSTPTGAASYSGEEAQALYNLAQRNPNNFDTPRTVRFGLKTSF